jgi:phospholipid/cholesterol/gamma-HCH transport system substrate-binding protein
MIKSADTLKTGIFVAFAIATFIFSIYFLGSERDIFSKQTNFYVLYKDVKGLSLGAPVKLGGVIIGRVADIQFTGESEELTVTLSINEKYLSRIRLDSRVSLETAGLLGDKFASISVGKDPVQAAAGGFLMASNDADTSELLGKAAKVVENTIQISDDIKGITQSVKAEGTDDFNTSIHELKELITNLSAISKEIRTGDGLFHALAYDKSGSDVVKSFAELSTNLKKASIDITEAAANLKASTETLKNGNGTVGALLVDSKLYDNLVDVTDGAKRSFILKQAIRSSLNNAE